MPPTGPKEYKFNPYAKLASMRLTSDEERALFHVLLDKVEPEELEPPQIILALDTLEAAKEQLVQGDEIVGLSSGLRTLDQMTRGFAPGELVIIYGDTSHGKSQLAQNITYQLARQNHLIFFIGLEMINPQNTGRFLQIARADEQLEVALTHILYPAMNDLRYENIAAHVEVACKQGAELIVIDQLNQLTRSVDNSANEISLITHEIKRMAVRFQVPIILISHINRTGNKTAAPSLSELKGSSSIEQDADICLAVWRDTDPRNNALNVVEVWQRKNRNRGRLGWHREFIDQEVRLEPVVELDNVPQLTAPPQRLL